MKVYSCSCGTEFILLPYHKRQDKALCHRCYARKLKSLRPYDIQKLK